VVEWRWSRVLHAARGGAQHTLGHIDVLVNDIWRAEKLQGLKEVLDNFGLDTCCGAHMTIAEAAAESGEDPETVLQAVRGALRQVLWLR